MLGRDSNQKKIRAIFALLCWEAAFSYAYETWVGPVYTSGLAGELGLNLGILTLLTSLPFIGATGQVVGLSFFGKIQSARHHTLTFSKLARALWFLPISLGIFWGARSFYLQKAFPIVPWFCLLALTSCVSSFLASTSGISWMCWMHGLIPENLRGRFFGCRQRYTVLALIIANAIAALCVSWKPHGFSVGYAVMGVLALGSAAFSSWLASAVPEQMTHKKSAEKPVRLTDQKSFAETILEPLRDKKFLPVLIFGAAFSGAMQLASPFFPYYFTKELHISMSSIASWTVLTNVAAFIVCGMWGRVVDRLEDSRSILWKTGSVLAVMPLFYVFSSAEMIRWIAPCDYLISGFVGAGFVLGSTSLLFRSCPRKNSASYFSVYAASCGLASAVCTFLGGHLAQIFEPMGGFRLLWLTASLLRFGVLWVCFKPVALQIRLRRRSI